MAFSRAAIAVLLAAAALLQVAQARFIIVGYSDDPIEPWTEKAYLVNYTTWTAKHPLYDGDTLIFKYRAYYHVVWSLGSYDAWDHCKYDNANFIGNLTAGTGAGFWLNVTSTPQYLACGVFGHCELGQKIIANGSLGPLPASMKFVDVPPPPPPSPPPSPAPPISPPPPVLSPPVAVIASPVPVVASPSPVIASPSPVPVPSSPPAGTPPAVVASPPPAQSPPVAASPPPVIASPPPATPTPVAAGSTSPPPAAASPPPSSAAAITPTLASLAMLVVSIALLL